MTATNRSAPLSDGDFVELSYTAQVGDSGRVIDTTDPDTATESPLEAVQASGPCVVILGEGHLFDPVEQAIEEAGIGESGTVVVEPQDAFGAVDPTAETTVDIEHVPEDSREPGAPFTYKGRSGFIESLDEEAATVNFNHPLAGMAIEYEFTVHDRVTDPSARVRGVLALYGFADAVEATFESVDSGLLQLSVTEPTVAVENWPDRKRRMLDNLWTHVDLTEVQITETYRANQQSR